MAQGSTSLLYPTNVDVYATYEDDIDICVAKMFNDLSSSVITIESKLGTNPQGSYLTVKDRIYALESAGFIKAGGTIELTANWDAGPYKITALQFESDIATGTAPFVVASTTVVTNLNADTVDGNHASAFVKRDGTTELTTNWNAGSYKISSNQLGSTATTGTAPLTITSTTLVLNLNADMLDNKHSTDFMLADGTVPLTANWDAGSFKITALQFESDIITGTAPFVVASSTVVTNLNADLLDGNHASAFVKVDGTVALTANWDAGSFKITASQLESDILTGTAPFVVASSTVVTNLNADTVDSKHASDFTYGLISTNSGISVTAEQLSTLTAGGSSNADLLHTHNGFVKIDGTLALTANWDAGSYKITSLQFESDATTGTAPFVVASTTVVPNLNADMLDGMHASDFGSITWLKPSAQGTPDNTVAVAAGTYIKSDGSGKIVFAGGNSPTFAVVTSDSRIDLLCIDDSGILTIIQGTQDVAPSAPTYPSDKLPIAEVTITETDTVVLQTADIRDVRPFLNLGGGSGGGSSTVSINQTTHGFTVGMPLRWDTGTSKYTKAKADTSDNAEVLGMVSQVVDADNFKLSNSSNLITGMSGLTAGVVYYLSDANAGEITDTVPTTEGSINKPIFVAISATSGYFINYRGYSVSSTQSYYRAFANGDLSSGILTVAHNLQHKYCQVVVSDNNDVVINPDSITFTSTTNLAVDLSSYGTISGTWHVSVLDIGTPYVSNSAGTVSGAIITQTANYVITTSDYCIIGNPSGSSITFTLPLASSANGQIFNIKNISATNQVIVDGNGSETIDGETTKALNQWEAITIISNGTAWYII